MTGTDDGAVEVWEETEGSRALKLAGRLSQHDDIVQTVSVSTDGHAVVSGGWDSRYIVLYTALKSRLEVADLLREGLEPRGYTSPAVVGL